MAVHVGAALQKKVLIDHIVQQCLRESVGLCRERPCARDLLDHFGIAQDVEGRIDAARIDCDCAEQVCIETRTDHRGFLRQRSNVARQSVEASQQQRLNACGNVSGGIALRHPPLRSLALHGAYVNQAAHDLLDEQRVAARTLENSQRIDPGMIERARGRGTQQAVPALPRGQAARDAARSG